MQVLSVPLRALLFCFDFFFGKVAHRNSSFSALLKYKIQDVTPAVCDPCSVDPKVLIPDLRHTMPCIGKLTLDVKLPLLAVYRRYLLVSITTSFCTRFRDSAL